jgi:hypothetical protein
MRLSRISAVLTALALALGMAAVTAAPANAATPTTIKLPKLKMKGVYGGYNGDLNGGEVVYTEADGSEANPYAGTAYLQRQWKGKSAWKNVAVDDSPGYLYFPTESKFKGNASYRIYYTGGVNSSGTEAWDAAYSAVMTVKTFRDLNDSGSCSGGCHLKGKVKPKYKKKKVVIQVKRHGHWKKYKKIRTNKKSKFKVRVQPSKGKGTKYRIVVPGNKRFAKTKSGTYRAYRY